VDTRQFAAWQDRRDHGADRAAARYLGMAAKLARHLGCPLVTLHSGRWTSARAAADRIGSGVDLIAIDVPDLSTLRLMDLETSRLLAGTRFARKTDTSAKRNLGLLLAHALGWQRIIFLDDDIQVPDPGDLRRAAGLLDTYNAVGLENRGFPDNSVVCHAFRMVGGSQNSFIGGGALAVDTRRNRSFSLRYTTKTGSTCWTLGKASSRLLWLVLLSRARMNRSVMRTGRAWRNSAM